MCALHFESTQFTNADRNHLNWNAIPTLFDVPNPPPHLQSERRAPMARNLDTSVSISQDVTLSNPENSNTTAVTMMEKIVEPSKTEDLSSHAPGK